MLFSDGEVGYLRRYNFKKCIVKNIEHSESTSNRQETTSNKYTIPVVRKYYWN